MAGGLSWITRVKGVLTTECTERTENASPRSWRPVRGRRAVAPETGVRDAPKSASQEDAKVRRLREEGLDPGPDAIRQAYRHPAMAGLRPDPPVGACLHANTSGNHRRAVFAAKAAPTKPASRLARSAQRNAPISRGGVVRQCRTEAICFMGALEDTKKCLRFVVTAVRRFSGRGEPPAANGGHRHRSRTARGTRIWCIVRGWQLPSD